MLWLAGAFFLALRKLTLKWSSKKVWWLPAALLALAVWALAYAPLPFGLGTLAGLAASLLGWAFGLVGSLIGVRASVIAGILLVLVLIFGLHDLIKDHRPDAWAKTATYALPVLALIATGSIAAQVEHFTHVVGGWGPTLIAQLVG